MLLPSIASRLVLIAFHFVVDDSAPSLRWLTKLFRCYCTKYSYYFFIAFANLPSLFFVDCIKVKLEQQ